MTELYTQQPKQFKILLIGDNCVDVYQYGNVDRLSPEAPVPVFVPTRKEERAGMVSNVFANLVSLGCNVHIVQGLASKKTRLVDSRSRQHILRVDEDVISVPISDVDTIGYDAIVVSDYNKGLVTYELIEKLIKTKIPVFVDTKKTDLSRLEGAWVKINELEFSKIKSDCSGLIVTKGSQGAEIVYQNYKSLAPVVEVVDVTGAGDTFLAVLTFKYLETHDIKTAVDFAIRAAAITVQHFGCYAPSLSEI
jgi:bifunctional ADP-heptose synthase (sugar kinase/adenylyltransferase)